MPEQGEAMKDFVEKIVRAVVDNENAVRLNIMESGNTVVVELRVAREDMGKVIGRDGNMAWALRTLVSCAAAKQKKRAILQILE
jgi:predicted RNA-binding protein YlqC (UPF0109 family)